MEKQIEEYKVDEKIWEELVNHPHPTIAKFAEDNFKYIGNRIFGLLSLQPASLIAPDITFGQTTIRSNLHVVVIAPPSSGKSSLLNLFERVTIHPFNFQNMTDAQLAEDLEGRTDTSLICSDADRVFLDDNFIKLMEGILEEKRVARFNMQRQNDYMTNCIFTAGCLPQSIKSRTYRGLMQRMIPYIYAYSEEQQIEIGKMTVANMFKEDSYISYLDVRHYYRKLYEIQRGHDDQFPKIDSYIVEPSIGDGLMKEWRKCFDMGFPAGSQFQRELQSAFRYLCASSILNMFNRKVETHHGKRFILPNQQDFNIAKELFRLELLFKWNLTKLNGFLRDGDASSVNNMYNNIKENNDINIALKQLYKLNLSPKNRV